MSKLEERIRYILLRYAHHENTSRCPECDDYEGEIAKECLVDIDNVLSEESRSEPCLKKEANE